MRAMGFEPEDYETDPVEVWPENHAAVELFIRLDTQWNWLSGMGGAVRVGLNYQSALALMERLYPGQDLLEDLQVLERAALEVINE